MVTVIQVYSPTQPNFVKWGGGGGDSTKKEEVVCENQRCNLYERWGGL